MPSRVPVALILSALLSAFGGAVATAQDGPAGLGEPVTIVDPEGLVRGSVTIKEVADPYTGNDPASPPPEGMRFVIVTTTFEAAPDQSLDAQPYQIVLQDDDGFMYATQYVPRPAEAVSKMPDLQGQLMAPDNRISGAISFIVPADAAIDRIVYQPANDRLVEVMDLLPGVGPALGDAVTYTEAAGASATITTQLIDPFTEHDPSYPPAEGTRFVMLQPAFENAGGLPYFADPYDLVVSDAEGRLYNTTPIYRVPGFAVPLLESQTLSPGDRVSGYVGYMVPADAILADVLYFSEPSRMVPLADLAAGASEPAEETAESPAAAAASPVPDASAGTDP